MVVDLDWLANRHAWPSGHGLANVHFIRAWYADRILGRRSSRPPAKPTHNPTVTKGEKMSDDPKANANEAPEAKSDELSPAEQEKLSREDLEQISGGAFEIKDWGFGA